MKKSLKYNQSLFKFLAIRLMCAQLPFEICFFLFYGPAYLWSFYLGKFNQWGWCDGKDNYNVQLLCGLFCGMTYKAIEVAFYSPWTAY